MPTTKRQKVKNSCDGICDSVDRKDWRKGCKCTKCGRLNLKCSFKGRHAHDKPHVPGVDAMRDKLKKPKKLTKMHSMKPEEIKQLATDIFLNKVFTSRHIAPQEAASTVGMVFIPLALGGLSNCSKSYIKDIGMMYEYLDKAGPRAINGYPIFTSVRLASLKDSEKVWALYKQMKDAVDAVGAA